MWESKPLLVLYLLPHLGQEKPAGGSGATKEAALTSSPARMLKESPKSDPEVLTLSAKLESHTTSSSDITIKTCITEK